MLYSATAQLELEMCMQMWKGFTASRVQKFEQRMTSYDITKFNKFLHVGPIGCPWVIPYMEAVLEVLDSIAPKDRHKAARNNCFFIHINFPSSLDFRRM